MKVPKTFVPERDLEKSIKRLLQGEQTGMIPSTGIVIDENIFKFKDIFEELEQIILGHVPDQIDREKYFKDLKTARSLYKEKIKNYIQCGHE